MNSNVLKLFVLLVGCGSAQAAVLAQYTFASGGVASNDSDLTSSASSYGFSNGGTTGSGAAASSSTHMAFFHTNGLTTSSAGAVAAPDYMTFTITPLNGNVFNLTSLTLDFGGSNAGGTATAFTAFGFLRTDAEAVDYSTDVDAFSHEIPGPGGGSIIDLAQENIPLGGGDFTNVSSPVTFRIYLYSSENTDGKIVRADNVILNGDLIPEPSAFLLAGIGGFGLCLRRSRK